MGPWSNEFVWDSGHIVFLGTFYLVLATLGVTVAAALWRSRDEDEAPALAWRQDFEELPPSARPCRHQLTGIAPGRACDNGFDCRTCSTHPALVARRAACDTGGRVEDPPFERLAGLTIPLDRLYHRGHTWVKAETDGTLTIGLDALGRCVVGEPVSVDLPAPGTALVVNGPAGVIRTRGGEVRVLAPVEGLVLASEGKGADFTIRVATLAAQDARHLLYGDEVRPWMLREMERLQRAATTEGTPSAIADGGVLMGDLSTALGPAEYRRLVGEMFLEP